MKYNFLISLLGLFLLLGCEEPLNWNLQQGNSDLIVVESVLTNENKNQLVRLTKPYDEQNQTPQPVSGALVTIKTSSKAAFTLEYPPGSGLYFTDSSRALAGKLYTLTIVYNGKTYFASASQPAVEPLPELSYRKTADGLYTLNFTESGQEANYIEYYLSWQHLEGCTNPPDCRAKVIYYDLKNVDVNKQFKPDQEQVEFPAGTIVLRKKYSVSKAYGEYLRGMLSETAWRGGAFDVIPANAPTNLSEGAVGFFAVSTVVSDTTVITDLP